MAEQEFADAKTRCLELQVSRTLAENMNNLPTGAASATAKEKPSSGAATNCTCHLAMEAFLWRQF